MQGYASREAAVKILLEQESSGDFLKDLFARHTDALTAQDRGLVREIALGVIRNQSLLDHNIDLYAARKPGPGLMRTILRVTGYQLWFMEVPDFAAVNVGVELAKNLADKFQAGFANAVLKKMAANGLQKVPGDAIAALAINFSHPEWLVKRWRKRLGTEGLLKALERNNQEAPLWLRVNPARGGVAEARAALAELGVETETDPDAPLFLRIAPKGAGGEGGGGGGKALHSPLFEAGRIAFQDPAAWLIAELADWRSGETLLDLCSAPGGKAACLVERAIHLGDSRAAEVPIVCNDISFRRLTRIHDAIGRLGHSRLAPVVMDPAFPAFQDPGEPGGPGLFDVVVVDAPCSNLGVLRRRPEARWNRTREDLVRLAELQKGLLASAARLASARGRIIYATCSPEEEETSAVVGAFLNSHPDWQIDDARDRLPAWAVKKRFLWLHPGETGYDGFFAARLSRKVENPPRESIL
ncbi:MAG: sun protein [Fibrobacteres bacterium]|nr:sun protein [Fibrobacterota bacterium]